MTIDVLGSDAAPAIAALCCASSTDQLTAAEIQASLFDPARPASVRGDPERGVVASVVRGGRAHIRLLVVHPSFRRQGLGAALLAAAEGDLAGHGPIVVGADAPDYLLPGADTTETGLLTLLESRGYRRVDTNFNMRVRLQDIGPPPDSVVEGRPEDDAELRSWLEGYYPNWVEEACRGLAQGTLVLSRDEDGISGFCAWDVNRGGWLGPMAVRPAGRQRGTGTPLLIAALHRMRAGGRDEADIAWVGPLAFYAKAVGAAVSRVFFVYRRDL